MNYSKALLTLPLICLLPSSCVEAEPIFGWGVYQVYGLATQTQGTLLVPTATQGFQRMDTRLAFFRTALASPASPPDFANGSLPPVCFGFQITPTTPPGLGGPNAGKLTFEGITSVPLVDISTAAPPAPVANPLECNQVPTPLGEDIYQCGAPTLGVVASADNMIGDETQLTFRAEGSDIIGPIEAGPIAAPPILRPTPAFEAVMKNFDPKVPVVAEWELDSDVLQADLAVVEIIARLGDNSQAAQILCLEPIESGRVEIPEIPLGFIPESNAPQNPLIIITSLMAVNTAREDSAGWGGYLAGAGRGTTHFSCRSIMNFSCSPP